ncbi:MAG: hypothetical protein ACOCZK_07580, partial [Planctomycetota bacterium]
QDAWEDSDGRTQRRIKIVARHVQFLGAPTRGTQGEHVGASTAQRPPKPPRLTPAAGELEAEPPF